jgi:membrane-associated phospholipid phosphatase
MVVSLSAPFRNYTFVDIITQSYVALTGLIILFLHGHAVAHWPAFVLAHALLILFIHYLIQWQAVFPRQGFLSLIRHFYPVIFYTLFYAETGTVNHMTYAGYLDPFFIHLEQRIFGMQPSLMFMARFPFLPVSELFYTAYFSYYLMILGIGLALFFRGHAQFFHYISVLSFVFYTCCLIYIFTPVVGPRIFYPELSGYRLPPGVLAISVPPFPEVVKKGPFYHLMDWIYAHLEAPGAAFPSSHVAVGLCTVYFAFLYLPRIRFFHAGLAALMCLSTVYCRYHYGVDVMAGIVTVLLLVPMGNRLFFQFSHIELEAGSTAAKDSDPGLAARPPSKG